MGWERFKRDIVEGDCCFICGAAPGTKHFNGEHILPDWILRKFRLHDRKITLPNLSGFTYGQYTVPCCKECNSMFGDKLENPISKLFEGGHAAVTKYVMDSNAPGMLFVWLSLIVVKTHLKDRLLALNQDRRSPESQKKISDLYSYGDFHHLHCIARTPYTDACLAGTAFGSFFVLPAKVDETLYESFDFADITGARSVLLRIGDVALVAVLDDACGALSKFMHNFQKISGPLSPIQLREVLAHLSYLSVSLKERPKHHSLVDKNDDYVIFATHPPECELNEYDPKLLGSYIYSLCLQYLPPQERPKYSEAMKEGRCSFLFDQNGNFISDSMVAS